MPVKINKKPGPKAPVTNWEAVYNDFFHQNVSLTNGRSYTLQSCAKKWKLAYVTVREEASKNNWWQKVKEAKRNASALVLSRVMDHVVTTEIEQRVKVIGCGFEALDKAMDAIRLMNPEHLNAKEAAALASVGFQMIRDGGGWPKEVRVSPDSPNVGGKAREEFERRLALRGEVGAVLEELSNVIEGKYRVVKA